MILKVNTGNNVHGGKCADRSFMMRVDLEGNVSKDSSRANETNKQKNPKFLQTEKNQTWSPE